ncbi:MAG: hypothetical protein ABMA64_01355 [Myxococcota bacterium]
MQVYATGGRQRVDAGLAAWATGHRPLYDLAVLAALDLDRRVAETALTYRTPASVCDPDAVGHRFGAASVDGATVVTCTERERVSIGPDKVVGTATHPWLADAHHALSIDGADWVVATGVDGVVELPRGVFHPVHPSARAPIGDVRSARLPRARAHPTCVSRVDGALWVTRGVPGDAVELGGEGRGPIAPVTVHDEVVAPDGVWFTAVDGRLVRVDPATGRVSREVSLADDDPEPLGWCRGLALIDHLALVGFTRLRTTRWRGRLAWARGRLRGRAAATRRPTRIELWDLRSERRVGVIHVEAAGLDAVFGIVAVR